MGLMRDIEPGRLVVTPHPVLLDGQTNVEADLRPGESLYTFLSRHVDLSEQWEVRIGGVVVPVEMWSRIYPKHGQVIECHSAVGRQAVMLVAMVALTYFTFGIGTMVAGTTAGAAMFGAGTMAATMANAAIYMAGSMLIQKVLAPKPPTMKADSRDTVYAIGAARNNARPYEPISLLLGRTRITPDYASAPYTWYEGDDMYLGMVLNVGINVQGVGEIYHADTLLSSYEGVQVYYSGIPGKPNQTIPLYSNADTINGGALDKSMAWVQRTTPADTVRVQVNIEGSIGDKDSKGRDYRNSETIEAQYRPVGSTQWQALTSRLISNANDKNFEVQRVTMSRDLPRGQYDVRVRRLYTAADPDKGNWSASSAFDWTNMVAVQADEADYAGMGRIGIRVKATGQLTGAMDQLRLEAWSKPVPVWTGSAWVTESTSNPGALALQFLRGIKDENGKLVAGVGLTDAEIDIPSLQAFMVHCAANGYTYDHQLTEVRSNGDQLDAILRAGFGALSWETGKLGVVWAAAGQPVSGVVNMATIKKGQFQVDYTLSQAADGIEATYFDRTDWSAKTLRVAAPGVTTMLNPAQIQLEGVTSEEHAAQLARWHLAQSLYQYKDITYSTDLEHLAYKRMDVLQLQHDLTQWGYGGRLVSVSGSTVTLDEPVPPSSTAHIGIRVPGEKVYRIMRVANFTGEPRDTVTLLDAWPGDAPLPTAETAQNYIWIYDFKATPGYRVRVVGKTLESDAKGASVAVVPESPEFWTYVKTGEYVPPQGGSLLNTLPKASNVRVSEVQVVTGDVIHTELSVLFDIKGQAARSVIFAGISGTEIRPVAETVTNQARFRIGSAGSYTILVRPYNSEGIAGQSASTTYTTTGADIPPPPFDWFTVTVEPGGLRRYAWGYTQFQPADLAGAEIRFAPGTTPPAWDAMTPLGEDGFFTSAFESDIPESGQWVFSIRARNTSGELSTPIHASLNLTANVGENIEDHEERITTTQQLAQKILTDFADMNQRVADVQAEARAAADALNLRADQLRDDVDTAMAQVGDILNADVHSTAKAYPKGDLVQSGNPAKLYRAKQSVPTGIAITNTTYWEKVGDYASLGEAVAANIRETTAHADELGSHASFLGLLGTKNALGTAINLALDRVRVSPTESLGQRLTSIHTTFGQQSGRMDTMTQTQADDKQALTQAIQTAQSTANNAATKAELTEAQSTLAAADQALAQQQALLQASLGQVVTVDNPSFEREGGWTDVNNNALPAHVYRTSSSAFQGNFELRIDPGAAVIVKNTRDTPVAPLQKVRVQMRTRSPTATPAGTEVRVGLRIHSTTGALLGNYYIATRISDGSTWAYGQGLVGGELEMPAGAAYAYAILYCSGMPVGSICCDMVEFSPYDAADDATEAKVLQVQQAAATATGAVASDLALLGSKNSSGDAFVLDQSRALVEPGVSLASRLSGIDAAQGTNAASINELREVQATSGGTQVINAGMESEAGWGINSAGAGGLPALVYYVTAWTRSGVRALRFDANATVFNSGRTPCTSGEQFNLRGYFRSGGTAPNAGAQVSVAVRWYDGNGSFMSGNNQSVTATTPGGVFSYSDRSLQTIVTAPPNAASVQVYLVVANLTSGGVVMDDITLERLSETDALTRAAYTLAVQAGGDVAGMQLIAGSGISAIRFLASMFSIVDPGGTGGYTHSAGVSVWRIGSAMIAIGPGFGAGSEFVFWAGPNQSNLNNCTRANAGMYFTRTNDAYFGGTLTAGALYHPSQATFTAYPLNVQTEVGPFVSQGGTKRVSSQFRYSNSGTVAGNVTGGHGQTFTGTVTIYRRIGTGAWTSVNSYPVSGVKSALYQSETNRTVVNTHINGAISYNDTSTSTSDFSYRAVVTAFNNPGVGGVPVEGEVTIASKEA